MIRKLTHAKKMRRKDANASAILPMHHAIGERLPRLICHQPGEDRKPESGNLSFTRVGSRFFGPMGYGQSRFNDSRGVPYTRDAKGTVHRVQVEQS